MKIRLGFIVALTAVLAMTAAGWAEYGTWTELEALPGPPGMSNAAFLGIAVGDANDLYAVGLEQTSSDGLTSGWKSNDGGTTWIPIDGATVTDPNSCDMLNFFNIGMAVASTGPTNVQYLKMGPDPACLTKYQFPACLFACMLDMISFVNYSDDGGNTYTPVTVTPSAPMDSYAAIWYQDATTGYMVGAPNLLARTQDGGHTWTKINAPGNSQTSLNTVAFIDDNTGIVASGDEPQSNGKAAANDPSDTQPWLREWQAQVDRVLWMKDPAYRLSHRGDLGRSRGTNGVIWQTTDGGGTWSVVLEQAEQSFLSSAATKDGSIWVLGEPASGAAFSLWQSTDKGATWTDVSAKVPPMTMSYGGYDLSAIDFSPSGKTGFLLGMGGSGSLIQGSVVYYSTDEGQTWTLDKTASAALKHGFMGMAYGDEKHAWGIGADLAAYSYVQQHGGPVANAGPNQTVKVGANVTLDGSASYSLDGLPLTYAWSQTAGASMKLENATAVKSKFTAAAAGTLTFTLTVNDGTESASAETNVTVEGAPADDDASPEDDDASPDDDDDASPEASPQPTSSSSSGNGCGC